MPSRIWTKTQLGYTSAWGYIYIYISWVTSFRELADLAGLEDMFLLIAPLTRCGAEECEEEEEE